MSSAGRAPERSVHRVAGPDIVRRMSRADSSIRLALPFLPVAGALFCIQLDFFSLCLALPTIAAELATSVTDLQWLVCGYMISLGSLLVPAGRIGDVLGRRPVLLTGVAIFGVTSLICGLASSVPLLVTSAWCRVSAPH